MKRKTAHKPSYTLDAELLAQYGFGSWLKKNASWVAPIVGIGAGIATAGIAAGPVTAGLAGLGASVGGTVGSSVGNAVSTNYNQQQQQNAQEASIAKTNKGRRAQDMFNQQMQQNPNQVYAPTFADGGPLTVPRVEGNQRATADSVKNFQGILTGVLADKTRGMLNVDSILTANTNKKDFNRLKIPEYAQQIIDTSGDYALTPEEQRAALGQDYDKYVKATRNYRKNVSNYSGVVSTKGNLEVNPDVSQENFGIRNMLERMPWSKEEGTPYTYLRKKANGGLLEYDGQSHDGPDGGIPVDAQGNPALLSGNKPVALTENKEVAWNSPKGTYIFSDKLGYAKEARKIMRRYEKRLGKEFDKEDKIASDSMNKELGELLEEQEQTRELENVGDETMEYKKGGWIAEANKSIKRRGTKGVCTGSKFGSSSCPPGSKRYNLAKTFRKMAKARKKEDGGYMDGLEYNSVLEYGGNLPRYSGEETNNMFLPQGQEITGLNNSSPAYTWNDPNTQYYAANNPTYANPTKIVEGDVNLPVPNISEPNLYQGNPWLHVTGGAANILGNALMQRADRRNRPKNVRLAKYTPQRVDYSESRRQTREAAELDKANILRAMRNMGAGYMPNAVNAVTSADRNKYNALASSMENEANVNTQLANEAAARNAETENRENLINLQNQDAYNARQRQYLQNYGQTASNVLSSIAQERAYYDAMNLNPYYNIVNNPRSRWFKRPQFTANKGQ